LVNHEITHDTFKERRLRPRCPLYERAGEMHPLSGVPGFRIKKASNVNSVGTLLVRDPFWYNRLKTGSGWAVACNLHRDLQTWSSYWASSNYTCI